MNEVDQDEVRVKLFDSSCFSQEYPKFPIHLGMCSYVYIEVEGKEKLLKIWVSIRTVKCGKS